jgi:hypothetical protein
MVRNPRTGNNSKSNSLIEAKSRIIVPDNQKQAETTTSGLSHSMRIGCTDLAPNRSPG